MMLLSLLFVFTVINYSDTHDVITVDKVSVQQGQSIAIPCSYKAKYKYDLKYLCSGGDWLFCRYVEYSDRRKAHRKVSISDNRAKQTFTVTMNSISHSDAGRYWCAVELYGYDDGKRFELQVTGGPSELYVKNQMIIASEGGSVSISCFHQNQKPKKWCTLDGKCVGESSKEASVKLTDLDKRLMVYMSNLRMEQTGWYYCSVGELQMPVHISVTRKLPGETTKFPSHSAVERKPPVWLIALGMVLVVCAAMVLIKILVIKCKWKASSSQNRTENLYVSMHRKGPPQSKQCGDQKCQDEGVYETMSKLQQNHQKPPEVGF